MIEEGEPDAEEESSSEAAVVKMSEKGAWGPDSKLVAWTKRQSVRQMKRTLVKDSQRVMPWDTRINDETRLPDDESVHLAGLVLVEAFPPSLIALLTKRLKDWPASGGSRTHDRLNDLAQSRSGASGGSASLGIVRQPGGFVMPMDGRHDPELPASVDAVFLSLSYTMPSLAFIKATFILSGDGGDLSPLLHADYSSPFGPPKVEFQGRAVWLRKRIPWSRPVSYHASHTMIRNDAAKSEACELRMRSVQDECHHWLAKNFPGRFAKYGVSRRPAARVMLCKNMTPFKAATEGWRPVVLGRALEVWRSSEPAGWSLSISWSGKREQNVMTFAARRADVAVQYVQSGEEESNWSIMQNFDLNHSEFITRYSLVPLLSIYTERLSQLRDKAGVRRLLRRPVREARQLDNFVIGDGLDAVAITSDIRSMTRDLSRFRWNLAEYTEDVDDYAERIKAKHTPGEFVPLLCKWLSELAEQLVDNNETTLANIRASADLRQSIANTRLQRVASILATLALVVAIIGVVIAIHTK